MPDPPHQQPGLSSFCDGPLDSPLRIASQLGISARKQLGHANEQRFLTLQPALARYGKSLTPMPHGLFRTFQPEVDGGQVVQRGDDALPISQATLDCVGIQGQLQGFSVLLPVEG